MTIVVRQKQPVQTTQGT